MNARHLILPLPGTDSAMLTLPRTLSTEALAALEQSLTATLHDLRRESGDDAIESGLIEYTSWLQRLAAMAH